MVKISSWTLVLSLLLVTACAMESDPSSPATAEDDDPLADSGALDDLEGEPDDSQILGEDGEDADAAELATEEDGVASGEIIGGTPTYKYWSIGRFFRNGRYCSASLVTRRVAITAAHCVSYGTRTSRGSYGWFTVNHSSSRYYSYRVVRYRSFGRTTGANDIALLQLGSYVPSWVVKYPRRLARNFPSRGERVSLWGWGCSNRRTGSGGQIKRRFDFTWPRRTERVCPGDSGGPTLRSNGRVFRINSGYYVSGSRVGDDVFGNVPRNYDRLMAQVRAWR